MKQIYYTAANKNQVKKIIPKLNPGDTIFYIAPFIIPNPMKSYPCIHDNGKCGKANILEFSKLRMKYVFWFWKKSQSWSNKWEDFGDDIKETYLRANTPDRGKCNMGTRMQVSVSDTDVTFTYNETFRFRKPYFLKTVNDVFKTNKKVKK